MRIIWHKVWHDLWSAKGRTLRVVLIIFLGASAIGAILGARTLITTGMAAIWQASSPATILLQTEPAVGDDTVAALAKIEGVEAVEGFIATPILWRRVGESRWRLADLVARDDYTDQRYTRIDLLSGAWPEGGTLAMGQGVDSVYGIAPGDQIELRLDDQEVRVPLGGVLYDPIARPPSFGGSARFFTSRAHMAELTGNGDFNRLLAGMPTFEPAAATRLADAMQAALEARGVDSRGFLPPLGSRIADPAAHFFQDIINGALLLLAALSLLALALGLLLVYNTIDALISRQTDQIGIMKAIGARSSQILAMYLGYVLALGLLALLVALPVGIAGAWGLNVILLDSYNADPGPFRVAPLAIGAQVLVALLAPLLAALVPVRTGIRITVREAISTYGLGAQAGRLERGLARAERLPRLLVLAIGNTFRHKRRALLTQATLILSGLIFMVVLSVRESVLYTFEEVVPASSRYDVYLGFQAPHPIDGIVGQARAVPGVEAVEVWYRGDAVIRPATQAGTPDDPEIALFGLPLPTTLYAPTLRAGRWLTPDDEASVVLNEQVASKTGLGVGDRVVIDEGVAGETTWEVVGVLADPYFVTAVYLPRDALLARLGQGGMGDRVYVRTTSRDPVTAAATEQALRDHYEQAGLPVTPAGGTLAALVDEALGTLTLLLTLLGTMAVLIGVVGSVALSGVLSLNVIDQRRELGVMRAIGARAADIRLMLASEALVLSWLSWLIALPLALPLGALLVTLLSDTIQVGLVYRYTPVGALLWFGIVTLLAVAASVLPARQALRTPVRASLAYF